MPLTVDVIRTLPTFSEHGHLGPHEHSADPVRDTIVPGSPIWEKSLKYIVSAMKVSRTHTVMVPSHVLMRP